jgi:hypothetical protein
MINRVPIRRLEKFFGDQDFDLEVQMGREWLEGDLSFTLVLYKIDRKKTDQDDVYGESLKDQIQFHTPIEFKGFVSIEQPQNQDYGNSKLSQMEPGNLTVSVYQDTLDRLGTDIDYGDYIGYYETEDRVRYYSVVNDGRVVSDNKHTYGGFKPFYRTIIASPVSEDEFRGL